LTFFHRLQYTQQNYVGATPEPTTPAPSTSPTLTPTRSPLVPTLEASRPLQRVGNNGVADIGYEFPLDACLGDCDTDDGKYREVQRYTVCPHFDVLKFTPIASPLTECAENLFCYQRDANDIVPGCIGGAEDNSGTDFCFERPPNYLWKFGNNGVPESAFPLGECEGDCDSDAE